MMSVPRCGHHDIPLQYVAHPDYEGWRCPSCFPEAFPRPINRDKVYSELDPDALQAAINTAEHLNRGRIMSPAISAAIKEYLRRTQ